MTPPAARLAEGQIADLALSAAIELERARAHMDYDAAVVRGFSQALRYADQQKIAGSVTQSHGVSFDRERSQYLAHLLARSAKMLSPEQLDELVDFCVEVTRALARPVVTDSERERQWKLARYGS